MTYADSVVLNASMQKALEDCSNEKAAIRKIEAERSK
nr:Rz1 lytic protein [Serratia proteamaculans]